MMKRKLAAILLAASTMMVLSSCGDKQPEGTPAVKVNDEIITQETIDRRFEQTCAMYGLDAADENIAYLKNSVQEGIIDERLVLQEAARRGIQAKDEDVQALLDAESKNYASQEEFEKNLSYLKFTMDEYQQLAKEQVIFNTILQQETDAMEDIDVRAYYDQHPEQFTQEQVRASHILVETLEEANDIIAKLNDGADFAQLAQENSLDGSAASGGDLGYFGRGRMVAPFEAAAFSQEIGTFSQTPVESEFGYHIILVTDKIEPELMSFEEVEASLTESLKSQQQQVAINTFLDKLRSEAKIEYLNTPSVDESDANNDEGELPKNE